MPVPSRGGQALLAREGGTVRALLTCAASASGVPPTPAPARSTLRQSHDCHEVRRVLTTTEVGNAPQDQGLPQGEGVDGGRGWAGAGGGGSRVGRQKLVVGERFQTA